MAVSVLVVVIVALVLVLVAMVLVTMVMAATAFVPMLMGVLVLAMDMHHVALLGVTMLVSMAVIMLMAVIVSAAAGLAMGMMMVLVVVMGMVVMTVRLGRLIGAAFRLEGRLDDGNRGAEAARHLLQHGIAGDADAVGEKFGRHVAVAEMPGEAREVMGVLRDDLGHRLLRRHHGHRTAVVELQPVAVLQAHCLGEVEQEHHVPLPAHGDAAAVAPVMGQHHAVGGVGGVPGAGGQKRAGVDHRGLLGSALIWGRPHD